MAEIELKKRVVYAGDVHIALLKAGWSIREACDFVNGLPKANVAEVRHGKLYNAHDVAEILAEAIGDKCACNINGNDEWLPEKCELLDACPTPIGVACWEQWLKWKDGGADNGEWNRRYPNENPEKSE